MVVHSTCIQSLPPAVVSFQATDEGLRSQIATLHTALAEAREENAARVEHEARLTSHFQVGPLLLFVCRNIHSHTTIYNKYICFTASKTCCL